MTTALDVTRQLRTGRNAIGVILGNGRFYAPRSETPVATQSYGFPKLCLQLEVEYTDGTCEEIVSDRSWKLHHRRSDFGATTNMTVKNTTHDWKCPVGMPSASMPLHGHLSKVSLPRAANLSRR